MNCAAGNDVVPQYQHVVLFNAPPISDEDERRYSRIVADLAEIPGVVSVTGGRLTRATGPYTHALIVELIDHDAYQAYRPHPKHRQLVDWFAAMSDTLVADFTAARRSTPSE